MQQTLTIIFQWHKDKVLILKIFFKFQIPFKHTTEMLIPRIFITSNIVAENCI